MTGDVFTNHVGSQHHNIKSIMETLRGSEVTNALRGERGEGERDREREREVTFRRIK